MSSRKRSNAPFFWLLFGAGGMVSALLGSALVIITGLATPLGLVLGSDFMDYARMQALAQNLVGKGFVLVVIALFAWHAAHRIFHSLHDVGIPSGTLAKLLCYGSALVMTLVTAYSLLRIGF